MLAQRSIGATRALVRSFSAAAAKPAAAAASAVDPEHQAWLQSVKGHKLVVPRFEWTLEWALPTPVPMHQFTQSPVVIEVTDRNPNPETLVHRGPNVIGGYADPLNPGKLVSVEEHAKRGYGAERVKVWSGEGGARPFYEKKETAHH